MDGSLNMLLICSLVANGNDEMCVFLSNFCITITRTSVQGEALYPAVSSCKTIEVAAGRTRYPCCLGAHPSLGILILFPTVINSANPSRCTSASKERRGGGMFWCKGLGSAGLCRAGGLIQRLGK